MEKPIPFNTPMVQAILDGRKSTTRRVVKPQPELFYMLGLTNDLIEPEKIAFKIMDKGGRDYLISPPYQPGDKLWVRETYTVYQIVNYIRKPDGRAFSEISDGQHAYKADGFDNIQDLKDHVRLMSDCSFEDVFVKNDKWHPSIYMPKAAARIWLEVTDVRVERLQDITEDDAIKEGILMDDDPTDEIYCPVCKGEGLIGAFHPVSLGYMEIDCPYCDTAIKRFVNLWDSLNAKSDYGWDANPWVWVIEFKRIER